MKTDPISIIQWIPNTIGNSVDEWVLLMSDPHYNEPWYICATGYQDVGISKAPYTWSMMGSNFNGTDFNM